MSTQRRRSTTCNRWCNFYCFWPLCQFRWGSSFSFRIRI